MSKLDLFGSMIAALAFATYITFVILRARNRRRDRTFSLREIYAFLGVALFSTAVLTAGAYVNASSMADPTALEIIAPLVPPTIAAIAATIAAFAAVLTARKKKSEGGSAAESNGAASLKTAYGEISLPAINGDTTAQRSINLSSVDGEPNIRIEEMRQSSGAAVVGEIAELHAMLKGGAITQEQFSKLVDAYLDHKVSDDADTPKSIDPATERRQLPSQPRQGDNDEG